MHNSSFKLATWSRIIVLTLFFLQQECITFSSSSKYPVNELWFIVRIKNSRKLCKRTCEKLNFNNSPWHTSIQAISNSILKQLNFFKTGHLILGKYNNFVQAWKELLRGILNMEYGGPPLIRPWCCKREEFLQWLSMCSLAFNYHGPIASRRF